MNADHERFADWDSAYVLGALSPADRSAYEEHLESCERCRGAVAELSPMPGLLARLSADRAAALLQEESESRTVPPPPAPALLDELRQEARRRRARRRQWSFALVAAAVALLFAAVAIPVTLMAGTGGDARQSRFEPVADAPLVASATLTPVAWGTRIDLDCRYESSGEGAAGGREWPYALVVVDRDGEAREVSSWRASPGESASLEAGTAVDLDDIESLEIRALGTGVVLMRGTVD
jgi:anti-sigma factor RsiW